MKILGASIGKCVHVAGIMRFLDLAKDSGYQTHFLGPAVPVKRLLKEIEKYNPEIVALSYRLSAETAEEIFKELSLEVIRRKIKKRFLLGCTPPVGEVAKNTKLFEWIVTELAPKEDILAFLKGEKGKRQKVNYPQTLIERIKFNKPFPLIRHHFGLPSLSATIRGAREIAKAGVVDILSLGPDQNAQEFFFTPSEMNPAMDGAGGVPIRKASDLKRIYTLTRCGTYPLLRCYSGTNNLLRWARMLRDTIKICFGAVPLTFYSEIDGRSKRKLQEAIIENQNAIRFYARSNIPLEVNESHQWALRGAPPEVEVASAYISAYNAKKLGVRFFIQQYMFNCPREIPPIDDLAKMFAKIEMVENLQDENFKIFRMTRTGLSSMSIDFEKAKGNLASSITLSMALKPHIVHVVGFSEADHAIRPDELIESCKIARGAIENVLSGLPDFSAGSSFILRKKRIKTKAWEIIKKIQKAGALTDPKVITIAIKERLLWAPQVFVPSE